HKTRAEAESAAASITDADGERIECRAARACGNAGECPVVLIGAGVVRLLGESAAPEGSGRSEAVGRGAEGWRSAADHRRPATRAFTADPWPADAHCRRDVRRLRPAASRG